MNVAKYGMRTVAVRLGGAICSGSGKSRRISEREMAEFDFAARLGALRNFRVAVIDIGLGGEDVIEPAHGSGAALKNVGDPSEGDHGPNEQSEVSVKGNQRAKRDLAAEELVAALPQHDQECRADERLKGRHEHAPGANKLDVARNVFAIGPVEAADLRFFLSISANNAHASKIFLDARGERGKRRLD